MLTESNLRELLEFKAKTQMVTLYLNTEPSKGNADSYKLRMRTLLKEIKLPQDVEAIERFFMQEYDGTGRSVAVFSCAEAGFLRAYPLALPVSDRVNVSDRPALKPITDLLDNYGGYGVALVDQQGARLFFFHLGELREQEGVMGEAVKHVKRGGASTVAGRRGGVAGRTRAMEETVDRNIKESTEFASRFFEENHVRRVLIGGTDANAALFRAALPKAWQSLVKGTFAMSMTASHAEVQERAMQIGLESERLREEQLVNDLVTAAAKGGLAVVGLADTLKAVNEDRVLNLVVAEGFQQSGFECGDCEMLVLDEKECENCGKKTAAVVDVVNLAIHRVMRHGGSVEVVHTNAHLENVGMIAAQLRY